MRLTTFGPAYDPRLDGHRIGEQLTRIKAFMDGGRWHTLREISHTLDYPEASISAQLRHLRKRDFGSYQVDKRRRGESGTWEYRMLDPVPPAQVEWDGQTGELFGDF